MNPSSRNFVTNWDAFFYKRFKHAADFADFSKIGACLTLFGVLVGVILVLLETIAFLNVTIQESVSMASTNADTIKVSFNISFPKVPCNMLTLDINDILGVHDVNVTRNVAFSKIDGRTGTLIRTLGDLDNKGRNTVYGDSNARSLTIDSEGQGAIALNQENFQGFLDSAELKMVTFGAPWCPYSRKLAPIWEEVAQVANGVQNVRIGKVNCMEPDAMPLCHAQHIQSFPTIMLLRNGPHSHVLYHGHRTKEAILAFLVRAQQLGEDLVTLPHDESQEDQHDVDTHQKSIRSLFESMQRESDILDVDPADPGPAMSLIEAIHKAGLRAPGDLSRAALNLLSGKNDTLLKMEENPENAEEGSCDDSKDPNKKDNSNSNNEKKADRRLIGSNEQAPPEGCNIAGVLDVKKVPGSVDFRIVSEGMSVDPAMVNMSHYVHNFFFGKKLTTYQLRRIGKEKEKDLEKSKDKYFVSTLKRGTYLHYLKIVNHMFTFGTGHQVETFAYSIDSHHLSDNNAPAPSVSFGYELSPLSVHIKEIKTPFYSFIIRVISLIGGIATIISLFDSVIHNLLESVKSKVKYGVGKTQ